jgi:transcriptional regulator with GAF, ATPase, and Fis domain
MELPPLRDRVEDIVPLAIHFLNKICVEAGREPLNLTQQQVGILQRQQWPGNIRELRNVIERAVILTRGARLRLDLAIGGAMKPDSLQDAEAADSSPFLTEDEFRAKEKQNLVAALRSADWRVWGPDGAAAMLGIKPSTLSYRMNAFGISKPANQ